MARNPTPYDPITGNVASLIPPPGGGSVPSQQPGQAPQMPQAGPPMPGMGMGLGMGGMAKPTPPMGMGSPGLGMSGANPTEAPPTGGGTDPNAMIRQLLGQKLGLLGG